jgi:soluble lytic murein transglycosylase-like protein
MRVFRVAILVLFASAVYLSATPASADVYMYRDADGNVYFTNAPTDRRYKQVYKTYALRTVERSVDSNYNPSNSKHRGNVAPERIRNDLVAINPFIKEASRRFRIPEALIKAVIAVESDFDERAISGAGAQGLMQLMPGTAKDLGVLDPFDPYDNISGGTKYLRQLANQFEGDVVLMLAAYNAGHNLVGKINRVPNIRETRNYVRRVLTLYKHYQDHPSKPHNQSSTASVDAKKGGEG